MKIVLFATILAVLAFTANAKSAMAKMNPDSSVDFGTALKSYFDAFQKIMPCGYPEGNIPVLAPFTLDGFPFHYSFFNNGLDGLLSNIVVTGMNDYHFVEYTWDAATNNVTYKITFPQLQFLSDYFVAASTSFAGFSLNFEEQGLINTQIENLSLVGNIALAQNIDDPNTLVVSESNMKFSVGDVIFNNWNNRWSSATNNFVNHWMRELVLMWQKQFQFNQVFDDNAGSMSDLINILQEWTTDFNNANCNLV